MSSSHLSGASTLLRSRYSDWPRSSRYGSNGLSLAPGCASRKTRHYSGNPRYSAIPSLLHRWNNQLYRAISQALKGATGTTQPAVYRGNTASPILSNVMSHLEFYLLPAFFFVVFFFFYLYEEKGSALSPAFSSSVFVMFSQKRGEGASLSTAFPVVLFLQERRKEPGYPPVFWSVSFFLFFNFRTKDPRRQYSCTHKLINGLERMLAVSSTLATRPRKPPIKSVRNPLIRVMTGGWGVRSFHAWP